jgi:hypothetical protein
VAKVTGPLHSSEARGRVGSLVYNTWRGIRTVKQHTAPEHEDDPKRVAHKLIVQAAAQRWKTLTDAQRTAWTLFADHHLEVDWTGHQRRLPGFHWYVRIQTKRADISFGYDDDPPTDNALPPLGDLYAVPGYGEITWYWTPDVLWPEFTAVTELFMTKPLSAGRNPTLHDAYRTGQNWYDYAGILVEDIPGGWYTAFLRPVTIGGFTGPWSRIRAYVNPPP